MVISIHALLAESDLWAWMGDLSYDISIHALLAESDVNGGVLSSYFGISIHALLAESDRTRSAARATFIKFLSTLSLRRATHAAVLCCGPRHHFYPRSPCGERPVTARIIDPTYRFLSTLSLRRATRSTSAAATGQIISIHALLAESDVICFCKCPGVTIFLSTLSLRRATLIQS